MILHRFSVLIFIFLAVVACKTQSTIHYSPSGAQSTIIRDTVMQHDSIYVHEFMQGDTVYVTKYRDRWRDKVVNRTDTVYVQPVPDTRHQTQPERRDTRHQTPTTIPRFYKNCTIGFFLLLLLFFGRFAFRIMKAIYLRK